MQSKWVVRMTAMLLLAVILFGMTLGQAQAVEIIRNGTIAAGQTIDDDVVLSATHVVMDGTVNGTLIAAGQTVVINGTVKSDVIAFGQTVTLGEKAVIEGNLFAGASNVSVRGKVNGSVFGGAASMVLTESARVGRNLYYGGYSLETQAGSQITRDLSAGGYQLILGGTAHSLRAGAAAIELKGTLTGDVTLDVAAPDSVQMQSMRYWRSSVPEVPEAIQPGLRIAEGAKIAGKLTYTSPQEQMDTIQSVPGGGRVYQTPVPGQNEQMGRVQPRVNFFNLGEGFWLWGLLRNLVTIFLLGALVLWRAPQLFNRAVAQVQQRSLASMGVGLLALVAVFFAIPVISITLILVGLMFGLMTLVDLVGMVLGIGFGVLGLAIVVFFTLFGWAGKLLLATIIGGWILSKLSPQAVVNRFGAFALGALIVALLAAIPFAGFLFTFLVDLAGIGALWFVWKNRAVQA